MRKPTLCICENKDADQLRGNRVFATRIVHFLLYLYPNFQDFLCDCTGWFVSDLVGTPNCWFSHAQAHIFVSKTDKNHCRRDRSLRKHFHAINRDFLALKIEYFQLKKKI